MIDRHLYVPCDRRLFHVWHKYNVNERYRCQYLDVESECIYIYIYMYVNVRV